MKIQKQIWSTRLKNAKLLLQRKRSLRREGNRTSCTSLVTWWWLWWSNIGSTSAVACSSSSPLRDVSSCTRSSTWWCSSPVWRYTRYAPKARQVIDNKHADVSIWDVQVHPKKWNIVIHFCLFVFCNLIQKVNNDSVYSQHVRWNISSL